MTIPRLGIEILTGIDGDSLSTLLAPPHIASRPVAMGSRAELLLEGDDVAPEHLFAIVRHGRLLLASGKSPIPVLFGHDRTVLPAKWVAVEMPCQLQLGETVVRLYWCAAGSLRAVEKSGRREITPPPSAMLEPSIATAPDSEPTTQKRPWTEQTTMGTPLPKRPLLPPPTPPPRRRSSPSTSTTTPRSSRDSVSTLTSVPVVTSVRVSTPTLRTPVPVAPRPASHDVSPPSRPTLVQPLAPNVPPGIPRIRVATASGSALARTGSGQPQASPHAQMNDKREQLASPTVRSSSPSGAFLFQMASRAVDAWNRFVDDVDKKTSRMR